MSVELGFLTKMPHSGMPLKSPIHIYYTHLSLRFCDLYLEKKAPSPLSADETILTIPKPILSGRQTNGQEWFGFPLCPSRFTLENSPGLCVVMGSLEPRGEFTGMAAIRETIREIPGSDVGREHWEGFKYVCAAL